MRALDRILVFDRGRVEQGSHAGLMRHDRGLYCALVRHQTLGVADAA